LDRVAALLFRAGTSQSRAISQGALKFEQGVDVATALRTIAPPRRIEAPRSSRPGLKSVPMSEAEKAVFERWLHTGPQLVR